MKIISLEIKSIGIGKFFPKEDKVELDILFNDGTDKEIFKIVNTSDAERAAENILMDLRKMEKNIHKKTENKELIFDNFVNIVVKNEDNAIKEISQFIEKIKNKIDEIKKSANSPLIGKTLATSEIKSNYNVLIAAIKNKDGSININPDSNMVISTGDTLIAIGQSQNITKLESLQNES